MLIKDIFERPIDRDIDTVIVAGQDREEKIFQELDEYVVTDELLGHFKEFFKIYSDSIDNPTNDIGVWISGFYGSGKSHFLKILSYILNKNLKIQGKKPLDFLINKIDDEDLIENITKASSIDNEVLLFNVASKASSKDSIIEVFYKVFNELRGYSQRFTFIEKSLDEENKFEEFKQIFAKYEGESWESQRNRLYKYGNLKRSLKEVGLMDEDDFNTLINEKNYDLTPENFAEEVKEYCEKKETNILFFIDEIGQFISEDSNLMLQLQSIVEELSNQCNGRSWVIVTSQDTLIDMTNIKDADFSKIQARFDTRLSLSSSQDDKIIKIRLLEKDDVGKKTLEKDFENYGSSLKNILTFVDSSEMKNFSNSEDYVINYPLIPYQFRLLQQSLIQIRENSAMGAGVSHGARSMIQVIHKTIKANQNNTTETIMPFYMFFDPIADLINQEHVRIIHNAEDNDNLTDLDVNVLKTLFLIKYVSDSYLKPNIENIATLMISNVNDNKITIKNEVSDSLNRLIKEVFVNKKDDCYYYLTNKQQEVNKEIKSIFIDENVKHKFLLSRIKNIVKESIPKKFEYKKNYEFSVDINLDNIEDIDKDLGLSFLSSRFDDSDSLDDFYLKSISSDKNFAILRLSDDDGIFEEINGILQIDNYLEGKDIRSREQVECEKQEELNARMNRINSVIEEHIIKSSIYILGEKENKIRESTAKELFNEILKKLFERVYYNFSFINSDDIITREDIYNVIKLENQETLLKSENHYNALLDLETYLRSFERININEIFDRYGKAPFGFNEDDISFLIAKLFSQKRISLILNDNEIFIGKNNHLKIFEYVTRHSPVESKQLFISIREEIDSQMKKSVKYIYKELSNGNLIDDLEGLMSSLKDILNDKIQEIGSILNEIRRDNIYPGKKDLYESQRFFEEILNKNTLKDFYKYVWENEARFYKILDNLNYVSNFYKSHQKEIFSESILRIKNYDDNGYYVETESINKIINDMKNIISNDSPYSEIQKLKQFNENYDNELNILLEKHKKPILEKIENDYNYLMTLIEESNLKTDDKEQYKNIIPYKYDRLKEKINESFIISFVIGKKKESEDLKENYINEINYLIKEGRESESHINLSEILNDEVSVRTDVEIQEFIQLIKSKIEKELEEYDVVRIK